MSLRHSAYQWLWQVSRHWQLPAEPGLVSTVAVEDIHRTFWCEPESRSVRTRRSSVKCQVSSVKYRVEVPDCICRQVFKALFRHVHRPLRNVRFQFSDVPPYAWCKRYIKGVRVHAESTSGVSCICIARVWYSAFIEPPRQTLLP
jgi:hypothetical protein